MDIYRFKSLLDTMSVVKGFEFRTIELVSIIGGDCSWEPKLADYVLNYKVVYFLYGDRG